MRRGGPAGRVRGHRMTGGTPKEVHWTAEQQKRPQRTYRGRKRRETAAKGSTTGRCFRPQNVVFVVNLVPPKIRLSNKNEAVFGGTKSFVDGHPVEALCGTHIASSSGWRTPR